MGWGCWAPVWRGVNGGADDEAEDGFRLILARLEELRTEENVGANGEVKAVLSEGLFDEPGRRVEDSKAVAPTLVVRGVRPRCVPVV